MNMPINPVAAGTTANPMTAGASPAAASPLGGFEALLAALFPGGEGQVASPLAKTGQAANGEAPADGAADDDMAGGLDATAQTLLAAFVTPVPIPAAPVTPAQGEAAPAAGASVPTPQILTPPIVPAPTDAVPTDPAQADSAQTAPSDAGFAAALAAGANGTDAQAKTPAPQVATPAAPVATAVPTAAPAAAAAAEGGPLPQELAASLAPQPRPAAEAAPQATPAAATAPVSPQAQQIAAASSVPAGKTAPAPTSDAPRPNLAVEGEGEGEGQGEAQTKAAGGAATAAAAGKSPAVEAPGLRKLERADAPAQAPAQQADVTPQTTQAPASGDAPPAASTATANAPTHVAGVRGAPETVATLAAAILKKLDARTTRFEMELDPAGLGKVDVRLEIGAHGRLTAAMAFENPQSAQDLKNRSGELARALEQAGFDVSDGLSFDVADNSGGGSNQNNGAQEQTRDAPWRGRAFLSALETAGAADAAPTAAINLARMRASGVDIKI